MMMMMMMIVFRCRVLGKGGNSAESYLWSIHLVGDIKGCRLGFG